MIFVKKTLNGDWLFRQADKSDLHGAKVPGCNFTDFLDNVRREIAKNKLRVLSSPINIANIIIRAGVPENLEV